MEKSEFFVIPFNGVHDNCTIRFMHGSTVINTPQFNSY